MLKMILGFFMGYLKKESGYNQIKKNLGGKK